MAAVEERVKAHRCKECTLFRCDKPDEVCAECIANGASCPKVTITLRYTTFDSLPAPSQAPSGLRSIPGVVQIKQDVMNLPVSVAARIMASWLCRSVQ